MIEAPGRSLRRPIIDEVTPLISQAMSLSQVLKANQCFLNAMECVTIQLMTSGPLNPFD